MLCTVCNCTRETVGDVRRDCHRCAKPHDGTLHELRRYADEKPLAEVVAERQMGRFVAHDPQAVHG